MTLYLSSLNIKDSFVESRKSQISIMNNNIILFNDDFSSSYSFSSSFYSFPSSSYSFMKEYFISEYSSYESSSSFVMLFIFVTLIRQDIQSIFNSSIDSSFIVNKDISDFMNVMIIKAKNNIQEMNDLVKLKISFEISRSDILIIKNMNAKNHNALNIS